jgi:hypothetical protein
MKDGLPGDFELGAIPMYSKGSVGEKGMIALGGAEVRNAVFVYQPEKYLNSAC